MSKISRGSPPTEWNVNPNDMQEEEENDPDEQRGGDLIDLRQDGKDEEGDIKDENPVNLNLSEGKKGGQ